jgi:hypothetical protein
MKKPGTFEKGQKPWNAGTKKNQDLNEIRQCKFCKDKKIITDFVKGKGKLYRYKCKECKNAKRRTGKISQTRFKVGHDKGVRFKTGHTAWYKVKGVPAPNKGRGTKETRFNSAKYIEWKKKVFEKDQNKCKRCGSMNNLHSHHIIPWKDAEHLRFDINNGLILCNSCHAKEEGFGIKIRPK